MLAILGGSGFEKFEGFRTIEVLKVATPFGPTSSGLKRVELNGKECLFLSRHGEHHEKLPSEVNYRANIFALKKLGARGILSFSAVGSLREEFKPGDMVLPAQYIDRTKGLRNHTFLGDGLVGHVSFAKPVSNGAIEIVRGLSGDYDFDCHFGQTYVCIEGPGFSTQAESGTYRQMGADIIGMTHFPEYALAREAGMAYVPCCFITDYDCWDDKRPHVTLDEVIRTMRQNNAKGFRLAEDLLAKEAELLKNSDCSDQGLRTGLMTPKEMIPAEKGAWLDVLLT